MQFFGPLQGLIIGILLIVFRKKCALSLQKLFVTFPKYEDGVKGLKMKFTVRPVFITILGVVFIAVALLGISSMVLSS